jgi:hypothetical protein
MTFPMLERGISGGQTGADQAAWRVARAFGIPTGGSMPRGFLTEDVPRPEFAELYGAAELPIDSYPARTERNVRDADATLWFGATDTPGARATLEACRKLGKTSVIVYPGGPTLPSHVETGPNRVLVLQPHVFDLCVFFFPCFVM